MFGEAAIEPQAVSWTGRSMNDSPSGNGLRVDQIDHVELFVPDRHEAARWYRRVLGLDVVPEYQSWAEDPHGPLMISSDGGSTKLALFQGSPQGSRETAGFHLVAFRVRAAAFGQFVRRLSELDLTDDRGRRVTAHLVVDHEKAYSVYFCDPFGHRLELTSYDYDETKAELARLDDNEPAS
jgi:catechol 2,3-dioxygenase-like lactoylglutathione lyase family enzyme